jgi:plasmid stabilization system protein ParE
MAFTVTWHPKAERELAELWLAASDRESIAQAADSIDQLLASDPWSGGEDFYGDRLLVVSPLAVVYAIRERDRRVEILQVWYKDN